MLKFSWVFVLTLVFVRLFHFLPNLIMKRCHHVEVGGTLSREFQPVLDIFRANIESGKERGAAFSVYYKGEPLLDIWGGYADIDSPVFWSESTTALVFSATKAIGAIVLAMFVDKGLLDYNQPISKYWPEFGQSGKENITVAMFLSHSAGLSVLDEKLTLKDVLLRPDFVERVLARQKPVWPAGTMKGYHATTFGLYLEKLIEKLDPKNRTFKQIFKEDIAEPFSIDFSINVENDQFYRASRIHLYPMWDIFLQIGMSPQYIKMYYDIFFRPDSLCGRSMTAIQELGEPFTIFNNPSIRNLTLISIGGTGTARGLAKLYSILAGGGTFEGRQLLSKAQIEKLSTNSSGLYDVVVQADTPPFAMGTLLLKNPDGNTTFGHTGVGGQVAMADPAYEIGISYVTNHLSVYALGDDPRYVDLERTLYVCLKEYLRNHGDE